jgi:hypothetical protein
MKRLATIQEKVFLEEEEATVTKFFFVIQGEEKEYKSASIDFRLLEVSNKLIKRDPVDATKVINESIFFDGVRKGVDIPDKQGGNACGRTFPVWEGVKEFSAEERQRQRGIAGFYTYLIGEVTFPKKKPELVNFRITPGQLKTWIPFAKEFPAKKDWGTVPFSIKVKGDKFATLAFTRKGGTASTEEDAALIEQINKFITEHNEGITNG